jgi:hypothetical protein
MTENGEEEPKSHPEQISATSDQRSEGKKKAALSPDFYDSPLVYAERFLRRATRLPAAASAEEGH